MAEHESWSELDVILAHSLGPEPGLAPPPAFAATLMQRVLQEGGPPVATHPPIAFPWRRALPLVIMAALAVCAGCAMLVSFLFQAASAAGGTGDAAAFRWAAEMAQQLGRRATELPLAWLGVALLLALLPAAIAEQVPFVFLRVEP